MLGPTGKAALIGAAQGIVSCVLVFSLTDRYSFSDDWFFAVLVVFATATGFAIAARYEVELFGVAVAGVVGMTVGGWVGVNTIGSYAYPVPAPPEDGELRIIVKGEERVLKLPGPPPDRVKRVPVGGATGVVLGWLVGCGAYVWLRRRSSSVKNANSGVRPSDPGVSATE